MSAYVKEHHPLFFLKLFYLVIIVSLFIFLLLYIFTFPYILYSV